MKISYKWLTKFIETDLAPEEISTILTMIGLEVESLEKIETIKDGLEGVIAGKVLTCEKHPDADKLKVTTVDLGDGEPKQIVCGAPNVSAGQTVVVATVGCTLYPHGENEGFKIKKSKIRGIESLGMICAEDELGLGTDHDGIIVIREEIKPGTPAKEIFKIEDDYVFEIGLTPNRIDAASHFGVARDLSAYLAANGRDTVPKLPSVENFRNDNISNIIDIKVEDTEACPRYMGITISNVKIAPSPEWLQNSLLAIGINPKNNVVDITNYILHSVGQPMHAFDADKIAGRQIIVRTCPEGTSFTTLDGVERKLTSRDLMICDAEKPMCIGGVLGGLDSGVTEETKNIFLECAYFNPVSIRKTARYHGINTDSSFRYERGTNPEGTVFAIKYAAQLIKELANGQISSELIDVYPEKIYPKKITVNYNRINSLIGKNIPTDTINTILLALDFKIIEISGDDLAIEIPLYRVDVYREADVIEEILRIYGYNNVEIPVKVNSTLTYAEHPDKDKVINTISDFLSANGFNEIMSNSLTKASYYDGNDVYPLENCVKILNPLSNDLSVMRQTLLYNALEAAQLNVNRKSSDLKLYEVGNCYFNKNSGEKGLKNYSERKYISILISGNENQISWNSKQLKSDFFTLKSLAEKLLKRLGLYLENFDSEYVNSSIYKEGLKVGQRGKHLLTYGILCGKLNDSFDIKNEVYFLDLDFDNLISFIKNNKIRVKELPKYPEVKRDLALLIDKSVTFAQLRNIALQTERKLLRSVSLFDVYEGDKLPEGKKSYALSFVLQDSEKTMTDNDIDKIVNKLIHQFEKQTGAEIRK
ncbi:MAG: phenylalanine--tRNA ligase subunit beta [Rikenellaceae bacterium]|nr:phenylalanine--tRNA ligase subunit beta [Rikenellaceae bacterium]